MYRIIEPSVLDDVKAAAAGVDLKEAILLLMVVIDRNLDEQNRQLDGIRDAIENAGLRLP